MFRVAKIIRFTFFNLIPLNSVSKSSLSFSLCKVSKSWSTNPSPYQLIYRQLFIYIQFKMLFASFIVPVSIRCNPSLYKSISKILSLTTNFVLRTHSELHLLSRIEFTYNRYSWISCLHLLYTIPEKITVSTPWLIHFVL